MKKRFSIVAVIWNNNKKIATFSPSFAYVIKIETWLNSASLVL